jgi:hypothetical protein
LRKRAFLVIGLAAMLASCITKPTPELIAACRERAGATLHPTAKARSLLVARSPVTRYAGTGGLLKDWRFDFVELATARQSGRVDSSTPPFVEGDPVDRVRLVPKGSPECVHWDRRDWTTPGSHRLSAPRGMCIAVERGVPSRAEMRLIIRPGEDDRGGLQEIYEAIPAAGGAPVARVVDYRISDGPEATTVDCDDLVKGFPKNPAEFVLRHIAERR